MKKLITTLLISLSFIGLTVLPTFAEETKQYSDVNENDWFEPFVMGLTEDEIFTGYPDGRFGAWEPINRAEVAKVLFKMKEMLQKDWLMNNLIEILLVLTTVLGWMSVTASNRKLLKEVLRRKPPVYHAQHESEEPLRQAQELPDIPSPVAEERVQRSVKPEEGSSDLIADARQALEVEEKNEKSNWWA